MSETLRKLPMTLPCFPCPHRASCCAHGASLHETEARAIREVHGERALVWDDDDDEWRTAIVGDRCVFSKDTLCTIHEESYYPAICRGFPWSDGRGGPYVWSTADCPEMPQDEEG